MESVTKSEILVKSALAATVPNLTITASVSPQSTVPGTATPASQGVPQGSDALITVTPGGTENMWVAYSLDGAPFVETTPADQAAGTYTVHHVTQNHDVKVVFIPIPKT